MQQPGKIKLRIQKNWLIIPKIIGVVRVMRNPFNPQQRPWVTDLRLLVEQYFPLVIYYIYIYICVCMCVCVCVLSIFFSKRFVRVQVVHPHSSTGTPYAWKKSRLKKNTTCCFEQILEAAPNKTVAVRPLTSLFISHPNKTRKICWLLPVR